MYHRPRKQFGQNFLTDFRVIQAIIHAIHPKPLDNMVEIGPGLGALTLPLLKDLESLTAIEIDSDLVAYFQNKNLSSLKIIQQDALTVDFSAFGPKLRVVGNLPYNISTPLLMHLLRFKSSIMDMHFMLQKEVVDRLVAKPNSKAYGRLSIMLQYHCEADSLFNVPPESFQPQPKVDSAIIRIVPYKISPYGEVCIETLQQIVTQAFGMRRKTLANNLKPILSAEKLKMLEIDPIKRPEQLLIEEYVKIAQFVNG